MKIETDFGKYVTLFFTQYLVGERGVSPHTLRSYSDTFNLFYDFMSLVRSVPAHKVRLKDVTHQTIKDFLFWLEKEKNNLVSTRNIRLAAIKSFSCFMQYYDTMHVGQWQAILAIKQKKINRDAFSYLTTEGMALLLSQIPTDTRDGRRHLAILAFLYDSGARASELVNLKPSDIFFEIPAHATLFGKGRKRRIVPLQDKLCAIVKKYMEDWDLDTADTSNQPLFMNKNGRKLTTTGLAYIISLYASPARVLRPDLIPGKLSPHSFRHSKAMHLLQSGVNIIYVRDILGHVSMKTTEIYARADSKQKREALENAYQDLIPKASTDGVWESNQELKKWLRSLGR